MDRLTPGMPLADLAEHLTAEEQDEVATMFRVIKSTEPGTQLLVRDDMLETVQRQVTGLALDGYAERMKFLAESKLRRNEPDAKEYVDRALQGALKARAANAEVPVYLLHIAEALDLAERLDDAARSYAAFIREQSQYPDDAATEELIQLAHERLRRLGNRA